MVERRRFYDSLPMELDPLTDSAWARLSEEQRSEYLRRHAQALLERHLALMDGQAAISMKVDAQGRKISRVDERLDQQGALLKTNTETTEACAKKLDLLIERSEATLKFADDVAGAGRLMGRGADLAKSAAWVVIPAGVLFGGLTAAKAFLQAKGWWPSWLE